MKYTYLITSNRKRYPKKYIMLVHEIQNTCMDIYKNLMKANRLQLNNAPEKAERVKLQTESITLCDELSCFVQLSLEFNLIGSKTVEWPPTFRLSTTVATSIGTIQTTVTEFARSGMEDEKE